MSKDVIITLFKRVKSWKQPKYLIVTKWLNDLWDSNSKNICLAIKIIKYYGVYIHIFYHIIKKLYSNYIENAYNVYIN